MLRRKDRVAVSRKQLVFRLDLLMSAMTAFYRCVSQDKTIQIVLLRPEHIVVECMA